MYEVFTQEAVHVLGTAVVRPVSVLQVPHLSLLLGGEMYHGYSVCDITQRIVTEQEGHLKLKTETKLSELCHKMSHYRTGEPPKTICTNYIYMTNWYMFCSNQLSDLWSLLMNYLCQLCIMYLPVQILFCALDQFPEASRYDISVSLAPVSIKVRSVKVK